MVSSTQYSLMALSLCALSAVTSGQESATGTTTTSHVSVKTAAKEIVTAVRRLVENARDGMLLDQLYQDVLALETDASDLQILLPGDASDCETNAVIKMAAAGTGSHEVLVVMLAETPLQVLNGRLSLSLGFLEHVALQMEDQLARSDDVSAYLAAIVFGANTTATIVETADKAVKELSSTPSGQNAQAPGEGSQKPLNRVRRQFRTSVDLGRGWSVGLGGVSWQSSNGMTTFNARPTFNGFKPDGFKVGVNIRF